MLLKGYSQVDRSKKKKKSIYGIGMLFLFMVESKGIFNVKKMYAVLWNLSCN